ncbi:paralemmin-1-like isoform X2 [Xyrauchen texanus]|uniref:paralemmin-1-like isoform X2 n=1 Tax=Xyrauchen texanus TaxID=154827 RepID=UPI002241CB89|nr:paralemmin-1-like isoform X2 [Xyrauchen texanus]
MEHEAEKYQQRLQAIAEKRRIQEEQERVRREKEDERLRLQQLKRKSLRDQWLMEGPPTSPDSTGPRSPLWGPKAQEMEKHFDKLQATSERLAEEEGKLNKHIEDGPALTGTNAEMNNKGETAMVPVETVAETTPNGPIVENGKDENKVADSVHTQNHNLDEAGPVVDVKVEVATATPGGVNGSMEGENSNNTPEQDDELHPNGLAIHSSEAIGAGGITMTFLGFKEVEPGQGDSEDDDVGAIIRAERVIITDEGEEITEDNTSTTEESAMPITNEDTLRSTEETGDVEETENHPESSADMELDASSEVSQSLDSSAKKVVSDVAVEEEQMGPELHEMQLLNDNEDDIEVAQVPLYTTTQPSPTTRPKAEGKAVEPQTSKEEAVAAICTSLGQFQEVPLDVVGETAVSTTKAGTEKPPAEQEPLLVSKASAQLDTSSPNRADYAGVPKRKTCQCCSIM